MGVNRRDAEVVVVGAGPAGAACAIELRRGGADVVVVHHPGPPASRPPEILSPATIRRLRRLGLANGPVLAASRLCLGVLSQWETRSPTHFDYGLYAPEPARVVDRLRLDALHVEAVKASGATVVRGRVRRTTRAADASRWRTSIVGHSRFEIDSTFVVEAVGRRGLRPPPEARQQPRHLDRQVAFSAPQRGAAPIDHLLIEADGGGWWYLATPPDDAPTLVHLTDSDLLPNSAADRGDWLASAYENLALIPRHLEGRPDFRSHTSADARTSYRGPTAGPGWLRAGDANWSLDPLSGDGIERALLSGERAARSILSGSSVREATSRFEVWSSRRFEDASRAREETHARVYAEVATGPYWRRRLGGAP